MRKTDVEISYHQGHHGCPMVNVKVYRGIESVRLPHSDFPGLTREYVDSLDEEKELLWAWESATETGWEDVKSDAEEVFGSGVKVWSAGRQGGWCVVEGLPDVDTWDAIMLGKWSRFAKGARAVADDVPYHMLDYIYFNVYERRQDEQAAAVKVAGIRAAGMHAAAKGR